jgi:solute carrier family 35 protein
MYLVLRRNTPLVVLLLKRAVRGYWPSPQIIASVATVCAGSVVAGFNDLEGELKSYCFAAVSCLLQAAYMLAIEVRSRGHARPPPRGDADGGDASGDAEAGGGKAAAAAPPPQQQQQPVALSEGEMLHYNALLNLPFVLAICAATGELSGARSAAAAAVAKASAFELVLALLGCAGGGFVLNWSMMLCTSVNSALTTTIVGVLKVSRGDVIAWWRVGWEVRNAGVRERGQRPRPSAAWQSSSCSRGD